MAELDDIWKLWIDFVFVNCYSYVGLYLALRGSDWKLRLGSLKQMAPLFAGFDHTKPFNRYQAISSVILKFLMIYCQYYKQTMAFSCI